MNKLTLLIAGLTTGIIVVLGYSLLSDDVETVQNQTPMKIEAVPVKLQSVPLNNEVQSMNVSSDNKRKENTAVVEEIKQVRRAPPPPISGTVSREVAHSSPHEHGHEDYADVEQQRKSPPPPTGANQ